MEELLDDDLKTFDTNAPLISKNEAIFMFSKLTPDELGGKFSSFLGKKGYKLEQGTPLNGKFGKGSAIMRVLFGAFVKRFAWQVTIESNGKLTRLKFYKDAKGYVGGVIGVNQVKNEYKSIVDSLVNFHRKQESGKSENA